MGVRRLPSAPCCGGQIEPLFGAGLDVTQSESGAGNGEGGVKNCLCDFLSGKMFYLGTGVPGILGRKPPYSLLSSPKALTYRLSFSLCHTLKTKTGRDWDKETGE